MQISCGIQGNTWWKQSRYKNVNDFISSVCPCCILYSLVLSPTLLSLTPSLKSHLLSFSPSSSHNQTSQISFSEMKSVSLCLMCRTVPVYSTWWAGRSLHCKKKESHRVSAQILMSATTGGDVGSIATVINSLLLNTFDLVIIWLCFLHSL